MYKGGVSLNAEEKQDDGHLNYDEYALLGNDNK
jgi:hypothetical protein